MSTDYNIKDILKNGKRRKILTYSSEDIKISHKKIYQIINALFIPSKFSKAYIKNISIYENAKVHMYNDIFVKLDIENFFANINH